MTGSIRSWRRSWWRRRASSSCSARSSETPSSAQPWPSSRKLQTPSNLLIVSLAVSDLLVAILVMPPAIVYELMGRWPLGSAVCDAWTSLDVLLCTASILNLCTISIDRYLVITRPLQYAVKRTPGRMAFMVTAVWLTAAVISIPPLFGWKADNACGQCMLSQEIGYQIYATVGAFYLPLSIMMFIYYQIYKVSSRLRLAEVESRSKVTSNPRRRQDRSTSADSGTPLNSKDNCLLHLDGEASRNFRLSNLLCNQNNHHANNRRKSCCSSSSSAAASKDEKIALTTLLSNKKRFRLLDPNPRLNKITSPKERKATKTLGVIMGAFTVCWLPFFILALIKPFCDHPSTCIPQWLNSLFLWLGYTNSFSNPIIYARFNRDFRGPFRQILSCSCRGINSRMRSESYADQYGGPVSCSAGEHVRQSIDTVVRYQSHGKTIIFKEKDVDEEDEKEF